MNPYKNLFTEPKTFIQGKVTMKKIYYILLMRIIFLNLQICASDFKQELPEIIKLFLYKAHNDCYKQINAAQVSPEDKQAYTALIRLRNCTYDHYSSMQQNSSARRNTTKELYNVARANAEKITTTQDPKILLALQLTLFNAQAMLEN